MDQELSLSTKEARRRIDTSILRHPRAGVWTCDEGNPLARAVLDAIGVHGFVVEISEDVDQGINLRYETPHGLALATDSGRRFVLPEDDIAGCVGD